MNNNENIKLDDETFIELLPYAAERERQKHLQQQDIDRRLAHCHLVKNIQIGAVVGLSAAILGAGLHFVIGKSTGKETTDNSNSISINTEDEKINLERIYRVEFGDSLSYLSSISGIPIDTIRQDNDMDLKDTMIKDGQRLYLNYSVKPENLKYYTETIDVNGKTVSEIASEYNTSVSTLCNLNKDSIVVTYNKDYTEVKYTITNNNLVVPNFISPQELEEVKGSQK